eukprot:365524-Chlamydomonas_euryale.AAC.1
MHHTSSSSTVSFGRGTLGFEIFFGFASSSTGSPGCPSPPAGQSDAKSPVRGAAPPPCRPALRQSQRRSDAVRRRRSGPMMRVGDDALVQ